MGSHKENIGEVEEKQQRTNVFALKVIASPQKAGMVQYLSKKAPQTYLGGFFSLRINRKTCDLGSRFFKLLAKYRFHLIHFRLYHKLAVRLAAVQVEVILVIVFGAIKRA